MQHQPTSRHPGTRVWQRGYDDHILRDDADLDAARRCIRDNLRAWALKLSSIAGSAFHH